MGKIQLKKHRYYHVRFYKISKYHSQNVEVQVITLRWIHTVIWGMLLKVNAASNLIFKLPNLVICLINKCTMDYNTGYQHLNIFILQLYDTTQRR